MYLRLYEYLHRVRPIELGQVLTVLLGIRRRVVKTQGMLFWVNPVSNFGLSLLKTGTYEKPLTELLFRELKPGDHFIDVGGNEGYFSVLAAKLVQPGGMVYCVEPQKRLWKIIRRNLGLNELDNVTLVPSAIGARAGSGFMRISPGNNTGLSSMVHHDRRIHWPRQRVPMDTLDHVIAASGLPKIDLVKIDVEGYEFEVLKSAAGCLGQKKIENLIVEIHPKKLEQLEQTPLEIDAYMNGFGYRSNTYYGYRWYSYLNSKAIQVHSPTP